MMGLPSAVFAAARQVREPSYAQIVEVQTALVVELFLVLPLRISNMAGLDLARHVVRRGREVRLVVPAGEVKNQVDIDAPLPRASVKLLDEYLARYRPQMPDSAGSTWLFAGRDGKPKCTRSVGRAVSKLVMKHGALSMQPHDYRAFAVKVYHAAHPDDFETPRQLLGHRSMETTKGYYSAMEAGPAAKKYAEIVAALRGDGGRR